jgi:hypothetical protein
MKHLDKEADGICRLDDRLSASQEKRKQQLRKKK